MAKLVKFPFGKADKKSVNYAAAMAVDIDNMETVLTIGQMTGAGTLNLNNASEIEAGANLLIKVSVDGTNRVLTPGTGMTGKAETLTANKSYAISCKHDGSAFVVQSVFLLN